VKLHYELVKPRLVACIGKFCKQLIPEILILRVHGGDDITDVIPCRDQSMVKAESLNSTRRRLDG